ncbi:MAG TPA: cupin domain-containing protein [Pyrinomonadaceae bacterium]|nr:cupin domain-containing protein [Pyrinomonadaceae bacterium]
MNKGKWNESVSGHLTFENICKLYSSDKNIKVAKGRYYAHDGESQYVVSLYKHNEKTNLTGWHRAATKFVLQGKCEMTINGEKYLFQAGEYFDFPEGNFHLRVIGDEAFECVSVCKMPDDFPKIDN